jgi:hypothetical protein
MIAKLREEAKEKDLFTFTEQAASMTRLGIDVSAIAREHEGQMRKRLQWSVDDKRWRDFTVRTAWMTALGMGVGEEVKKHAQPIKDLLQASAKDKQWSLFTMQAADMADIGMLAPNPQYGRDLAGKMPPLRKFGAR